jgi:hypothetical protein
MSDPARMDPASHPTSYYDVNERGTRSACGSGLRFTARVVAASRIGGVMQHYARVRQADDDSQITGELPILEETVVETIYQLDAGWRRTDARCELSEAAEEHTLREMAELRAELKKDKIIRDLLLERVSKLEEEARWCFGPLRTRHETSSLLDPTSGATPIRRKGTTSDIGLRT